MNRNVSYVPPHVIPFKPVLKYDELDTVQVSTYVNVQGHQEKQFTTATARIEKRARHHALEAKGAYLH